jgi:hypothetical protein
MAAILCTHRAQVSPASLCSPVSLCAFGTQRVQVSLGSFPPQSRYALMLRLHKSRLGRSLPSLAMHEIADSPPTRTGDYRIYQTRPRLWVIWTTTQAL